MEKLLNVPNCISIFRTFLVPYSFWFFVQNQNQYIFFAITCLVIALDGLDGIAARKLNQATVFGAKLDIFCDRFVELAYWLFFAYIGVLHVWVFWFFLCRGLLVDYLSSKSDKPLGDSFLRSSRFMRMLYGSLKLLSFSLLILTPTLWLAHIVTYATVLVCFLRAIPVLKTWKIFVLLYNCFN